MVCWEGMRELKDCKRCGCPEGEVRAMHAVGVDIESNNRYSEETKVDGAY